MFNEIAIMMENVICTHLRLRERKRGLNNRIKQLIRRIFLIKRGSGISFIITNNVFNVMRRKNNFETISTHVSFAALTILRIGNAIKFYHEDF